MTIKTLNRINILQALTLPVLLFVALAVLPSASASASQPKPIFDFFQPAGSYESVWLPKASLKMSRWLAPEFSRLVSIPGGTPAQRLSVSLGNAGYTGSSAMDELTICNPSTNANTMYLGSASNVNASTGFPLEQGSCISYRAAGRPVEASAYFIYVAATADAAITLRQR